MGELAHRVVASVAAPAAATDLVLVAQALVLGGHKDGCAMPARWVLRFSCFPAHPAAFRAKLGETLVIVFHVSIRGRVEGTVELDLEVD
ncbi:MAG: hypothetical protein ACE5G2_09765, partial [Candidatus Krumholzibacteriia bacterium]